MITGCIYCEHLIDTLMSYEEVTAFEKVVGVDALMGQLLTVEKAFEMGFSGNGYLGVLQDDHCAFCKKEPPQKGDFVEVTGVMQDGTTLFVKKVEVPVNSVHETLDRVDARSQRNESGLEALRGEVYQWAREIQWIKDRLHGG